MENSNDIYDEAPQEIIIGDNDALLYAWGKNECSELTFSDHSSVLLPAGLNFSKKY